MICQHCSTAQARPRGRFCSDRCANAAYYAAKSPAIRAKQNAYNRVYYRAHKDEKLAYARRRRGVSQATAERRYGECPICLTAGPLVLDHDHETGAGRGWLCSTCNSGLGKLGDTIEGLQRAIVYLSVAR